MTRRWVSCTKAGTEHVVRLALASFSPSGQVSFVHDAAALRGFLRDEQPGSFSALVGFCDGDVSAINLAAALVADGLAEEVVLVAQGVTGSLRSRAACAGITRVVDVDELTSSVRLASASYQGEESHSVDVNRTEGKGGGHESVANVARAPIVTLVSGRGGVGKTALAAVASAAAGRWGMRVALCDLDLTSGNLYEYFGLHHGSDLPSVVVEGRLDHERLASAGLAAADGVTLWGPCGRPEMAEVVAPVIGELVDVLASDHDLVIVDTSTACSDAVAQAMQKADRLVIVHDATFPDYPSVARVSALAVRLGVARTCIARIENGCIARDIGQPFLPRAEVGLETARAFRIVDGGSETGELLHAGNADSLSASDTDFAQTTCAFLAQLLKELGSLPDCEEARHLSEGIRRPRGFAFFGRRREAI